MPQPRRSGGYSQQEIANRNRWCRQAHAGAQSWLPAVVRALAGVASVTVAAGPIEVFDGLVELDITPGVRFVGLYDAGALIDCELEYNQEWLDRGE